jgi:hypothetical protein
MLELRPLFPVDDVRELADVPRDVQNAV